MALIYYKSMNKFLDLWAAKNLLSIFFCVQKCLWMAVYYFVFSWYDVFNISTKAGF